MKEYTIWDEKGFNQLPREIHLLDANVFIGAIRGEWDCWRIIEAQDKSNFKFGIVYGTEKEIIASLIEGYNGVGCNWVYEILKNRNFIRIRMDKKLIKNKRKYGAVDAALLTLAYRDEVKSIISLDFKHLSRHKKFLRPSEFVAKYMKDLIKVDESWKEFRKKLEREKSEGRRYTLEDFQELWIVPYDY